MPITQERFYKLVQAARAFYNEMAYLRTTILDECSRVEANSALAPDAISALARAAVHSAASNEHAITLGIEEKHHQLTHRKNAYAAERQRQRRSDSGIKPREKGPTKAKAKRQRDSAFEIDFDEGQGPTSDKVDDMSLPLTVLGPEPSPLELAEQILRDNEDIAGIEDELAKAKAAKDEAKGAEDDSATETKT